MLRRTLLFGNPVYLSTKNEQLVIKYPDSDEIKTVPIEDIWAIVLENPQITITNKLLQKLCEYNVAMINCDYNHLPIGLMLTIDGNSLQSKRFRIQLDTSKPLKKQLWQQTVIQKIKNQADLLKFRDLPFKKLNLLSAKVLSGDSDNIEAQAANYYWTNLFGKNFLRDRNGEAPNQLLNYGYSIIRSLIARSLVANGLIVTLGIHHKNKYNAYCLADDIMEPYRPFVDMIVCDFFDNKEYMDITIEHKRKLINVINTDVYLDGKTNVLMNAVSKTSYSLYNCFEGTCRKIIYPQFID